MKYLICLFFLLLSFGQLERFSFFNQTVNIYLHEVVLLFIIIFYLVKNSLNQKFHVRKKLTSLEKASAIFFIILFLSLINDVWQFTFLQNAVGFLYFARLCIYFIFYFTLGHWFHRSNKQSQNAIRKGMIFFFILMVVFSYIQYFLYPNLRNLSYLGWDPHIHRAFGLFFDTSVAGIIYVLFFFATDNFFERYKWVVKYAFFILILLTYARVAYITFVLGLLCVMIRHRSLKNGVFIIFLILFIFFIPSPLGEGGKLSRTYTITARMENNKEGLMLWLKHPLLGYGYNRLRYIRIQEVLNHAGASFPSSYITILVASGLAGLFSFIFLLSVFFRKVSFNGKLLIFVVAFSSFFDNIFLNNFIMTIFFILMTIV